MAKKLRCYLGQHRWLMETFEERPYAVCSDCSKEDWDHYQPRKGSRRSGTDTGNGLGTGVPPGFGGG
ncbi:MAG TPA: hypothetical protein VES21_00695 [Nocardioidaceae bacterium]|nr:hypothetical protein [Nocardioidaceae bacterium]